VEQLADIGVARWWPHGVLDCLRHPSVSGVVLTAR
jgi:hypothetical protein